MLFIFRQTVDSEAHKMLYTKFNILCVSTAIGVWVILSKWTTSTGTGICGSNEFWDTIEKTCSKCTKEVCKAYGKDYPEKCHCVCFPDSRECRTIPEFDPSELTTKSETRTHRDWLIAITVILSFNSISSVGFIAFILWYLCKDRTSTQGVQDEAGLVNRVREEVQLQLNNHGRQPDNGGYRPVQPGGDNDRANDDVDQPLVGGLPLQQMD